MPAIGEHVLVAVGDYVVFKDVKHGNVQMS